MWMERVMKGNGKNENSAPVDFVIPWVDGSDEAWLREKRKYEPGTSGAFEKKWTKGDSRYRDWDLLRFWFRGVERFAPWVHRIWFVTWGHYPSWLNTVHPKLRVVRHEEYIPAQYLPTFSSHTIELNLHRIPGLSEQFVYFNDDMFLTGPVKKTDFFRNGLPCDTAVLLPVILKQNGVRAEINDLYVINEFFEKRKVMMEKPWIWYNPKYGRLLFRTLLLTPFRLFPGFFISHLPCAYRKQTFTEVWEKAPEILDRTCRHRFRETTDVNQWLFEYWQFCTGIIPRDPSIGQFYEGKETFREMCRDIAAQKYRMVCCNDSPDIEDFEAAARMLHKAFGRILPEKSAFEK